MKFAVVVIDTRRGSLTRYEHRNQLRRTHRYVHMEPVGFTAENVEYFRSYPPGEFSLCGPAPIPGGDDPGGAAPAMALAA